MRPEAELIEIVRADHGRACRRGARDVARARPARPSSSYAASRLGARPRQSRAARPRLARSPRSRASPRRRARALSPSSLAPRCPEPARSRRASRGSRVLRRDRRARRRVEAARRACHAARTGRAIEARVAPAGGDVHDGVRGRVACRDLGHPSRAESRARERGRGATASDRETAEEDADRQREEVQRNLGEFTFELVAFDWNDKHEAVPVKISDLPAFAWELDERTAADDPGKRLAFERKSSRLSIDRDLARRRCRSARRSRVPRHHRPRSKESGLQSDDHSGDAAGLQGAREGVAVSGDRADLRYDELPDDRRFRQGRSSMAVSAILRRNGRLPQGSPKNSPCRCHGFTSTRTRSRIRRSRSSGACRR